MKVIRILFILAGIWASVAAQGNEKTVTKSDGQHTFHYFEGIAAVSSEIHWNHETGNGQAVAFNRAGKEIYRQALSRRNLIQSVQFSYYEDGAVKTAPVMLEPIFRTEYYVINKSKKPLIVKLLNREGHPLPEDKFQPREVQPDETLRCGEFVTDGHPADPCEQIQFALAARRRRWLSGAKLDCKNPIVKQLGTTDRQLYYQIKVERMPFY